MCGAGVCPGKMLGLKRVLCCRRNQEGAKPKSTPLPKAKLIVISAVLFVSQFGVMMVFPFLPFMVHDFFPELSRQELGRKVGYLGSAYFLGNFAGSLMWGWLSDIWGRRPAILSSIFGIIISATLFGFSQNFAWAVSARLMWGFLSGILGIAKTYISEVCDDTNQARGFATIGTIAGVGRLLGSVVGGFLAQPASKYEVLQSSFFCQFPYVLPCLVEVTFGVISFIAAFIFLDETLHTKKKRRSNSRENSDNSVIHSEDSGIELIRPERNQETDEGADSDVEMLQIAESDIDSQSDFEVVSLESSDTELLIESRGRRRQRHRAWTKFPGTTALCRKAKEKTWEYRDDLHSCVSCCVGIKECNSTKAQEVLLEKLEAIAAKLKQMLMLLCDRRVLISTALYGLYAFAGIMSQELLPLLAVTSYGHGGYSFDDNEIGLLLMSIAVFQFLWQILLYPHVAKRLGYRKTFQLGVLIYVATIVVLPFANQVTGPISNGNMSPNTTNYSIDHSGSGSGTFGMGNDSLLNLTDYCGNILTEGLAVNENSIKRVPIQVWLFLIGVLSVLVIGRVSSLTSVIVLISNSALPVTRGTVNGIGQSFAAIGRTAGPLIASLMFAWSENNGLGWPLNYHFMFEFSAVIGLFILCVSLLLPKTIEKKRDTLENANS